jgi:hypothetical protein
LNVVTDSDKNKDLIRQWIAFGNAGFAGGFEPFISDDYIGHLDATAMDRNELERLERQFCIAFPDAQHSIDDLIAEAIVWFFERQRGLRTVAHSRALLEQIDEWSSLAWSYTGSRTAKSPSHGAKSTSSA